MKFAVALLASTTLIAGCGLVQKSGSQQATDYLVAGLSAQGKGNLAEAADDYTKALNKDPSNKIAYYDRGLVEQTQGKNADAERDYRAALQVDPNFTAALFNLAILRQGISPDEAAALYRHVIALQPNDAGPHLNLAFLLRSLGQHADAKVEFDKAVAIDPTLAGRVPADLNASPSPTPRR